MSGFQRQAGLIGAVCGLLMPFATGELPPLSLWIIAGVVALAMYRFSALLATVLLALIIGSAWSALRSDPRLSEILQPQMEAFDQTIVGYLCSIPEPAEYGGQRLDFCVSRWVTAPEDAPSQTLPSKLRLSIYGEAADAILPQQMQIVARLKEPHGRSNPEGFNYETWLFRHNYGAVGTIREWSTVSDEACWLHCQFHQWRIGLSTRLHATYAEASFYPLMASLLLGDRSALSADDWEVLRATGTIHLVAISGLHIGMVATIVSAALAFVLRVLFPGRLSPAWARRTILSGTLLASLAYALLAGFTIPTQRALIMVAVALWAFSAGRVSQPGRAWLLAVFLVLVFDPFAALDQGFWLSFTAVGLLLFLFSGRLRQSGALKGLVLAQLAVFLGLWPALVLVGGGQPVAGAFVNILAIPALGLLVLPAIIVGMVFTACGWSSAGYWILETVLGGFWKALTWASTLSVVELPTMPVLALVVAAAITVTLRTGPRRVLLLQILVLSLAAAVSFRQPVIVAINDRSAPEVWVWDVGQGLAVLIRSGDQALLYDVGAAYGDRPSLFTDLLAPNLEAIGVNRLDVLIASHADNDHAGGIVDAVKFSPRARRISGEPERLAELFPGLPAFESCPSDEKLRVGEWQVTFWQLEAPGRPGTKFSSNDLSCVVVARTNETEFILPGDISRKAEAEMAMAFDPGEVPNRVVVAPHHGSNTSSSPVWISHFRPQHVIFTAGYRHRYGHPHPDVVERYIRDDVKPWNVALTGALRITVEEEGLSFYRQRDHGPFWHRPARTE